MCQYDPLRLSNADSNLYVHSRVGCVQIRTEENFPLDLENPTESPRHAKANRKRKELLQLIDFFGARILPRLI